jgi:hypothetical protein
MLMNRSTATGRVPGKRYDDARIRVDASSYRRSGEDNDMGVSSAALRMKTIIYAFLISSDGYGGIVKVKDGAVPFAYW